jgi:hypothetical protein
MIVVIDSNILFSDFHLRRPRLRLIRAQAKAGAFKLAIPEVVVLETVNLYREEVTTYTEKLAERCEKPLERLKELSIEVSMPSFDVKELVANYERELRDLLDDVGADIPGLPGVEEIVVVKRALERRKPFKKNTDAGYRDTLIWHNVLELADEDEVVLISKNDEDFAVQGKPDELAEDLRNDLEAAGLDSGRVTLMAETSAFIKTHIPASERVRNEVQHRLVEASGEPFEEFEELADEALQGYGITGIVPGVREAGVDEVNLPYGAEEEGVDIEYVDDLREVEVSDARVEGDSAVLEVSGVADLTLSFFIPNWELWRLDEDDGPEALILDRNWNEHYAWAEAMMPIRFEAVASYNVEKEEFESVEVTHLANA